MAPKKAKNKALQRKVGKRLRQLRKHAGWTQEELAKKARMDWKYYGMIERGELNITLDTLGKLGKAFDIELYQILLFSTEGIKEESEADMEKFIDILEKVDTKTKRKILRIAQLVVSDD